MNTPAGTDARQIVDRIWARDAALWTGHDEAKWLGWLDGSARVRQLVDDFLRFAEETLPMFPTVVLLGMGGPASRPRC